MSNPGQFGNQILKEYCGESITRFYTNDTSRIFLNEYEIGEVLIKNYFDFLLFVFVALIVQITISMYCLSRDMKKISIDDENKSDENKVDDRDVKISEESVNEIMNELNCTRNEAYNQLLSLRIINNENVSNHPKKIHDICSKIKKMKFKKIARIILTTVIIMFSVSFSIIVIVRLIHDTQNYYETVDSTLQLSDYQCALIDTGDAGCPYEIGCSENNCEKIGAIAGEISQTSCSCNCLWVQQKQFYSDENFIRKEYCMGVNGDHINDVNSLKVCKMILNLLFIN
eukprot:260020_1